MEDGVTNLDSYIDDPHFRGDLGSFEYWSNKAIDSREIMMFLYERSVTKEKPKLTLWQKIKRFFMCKRNPDNH